jgi:hypothetical protein
MFVWFGDGALGQSTTASWFHLQDNTPWVLPAVSTRGQHQDDVFILTNGAG